jgi:hypothetical protein
VIRRVSKNVAIEKEWRLRACLRGRSRDPIYYIVIIYQYRW